LHAQPQNANITTLNNRTGLSGLSVKSLHIDQSSQIWIESENGLERWDGYTFERLEAPSFPSTSTRVRPARIQHFGEDSTYVYFMYDEIATNYDVYHKFLDTFFQRSYSDLGIREQQIITIDSENNPWVYHHTADSSVFTCLTKPFRSAYTFIPELTDFAVSSAGIWTINKNHRIRFLAFDQSASVLFDPITDKYKVDIDQVSNIFHVDANNKLWFSLVGYGGIYTATIGEKKPNLVPEVPLDVLSIMLWEDKKGRKLVALSSTRQLVHEYRITEDDENFKTWNFLAEETGIPTNVIGENFYQQVHFATHQDLRIIHFYPAYIQYYLKQKDTPKNRYGTIITALTKLSSDEVLVTTEKNQHYIYPRREGQDTLELHPLSNIIGQFPTLTLDGQYIFSAHRISQIENEVSLINLTTKDVKRYRIPSFITGVSRLPDNKILIAAERYKKTLLYIFDIQADSVIPINMKEYPLIEESDINQIYYDDGSGRVYFCTFNNGLLHADCSENIPAKSIKIKPTGFEDKNIISVGKNSKNELVVGSYSGIYFIDPVSNELIDHITREDGLSSNIAAAIIEDHQGIVWVSTFAGLNHIHPSDKRIGQYFTGDGLPYNEFNRNAAIVAPDGNLLFGSGNGLVSIDPIAYAAYEKSFELQFSHADIRTKNSEIRINQLPNEPITMTSGDVSSINLFVGNNDWGFTDEVKYHYRHNDIWNRTSDGEINIDRLLPGTNEIEVKAMSRYGEWSQNNLELSVFVRIPFFQRTWVRITMIAILLGLLALAYLLFDRNRLRQRLKFQKRVSTLELSLLQSQMNPHFIFNALGAIQFYIYNNKSAIADSYLSKFAALMRMFLESSRNKFISLEEELKLINGYVELEQLRFPDRFTYNLDIQLSEELDEYEIPSMLLQPFVENAINHGIFHADTGGNLLVRFTENTTEIICAIDDDGIGRKAAIELRKNRNQGHKSRSTQITEERLEILQKAENMYIGITYKDYSLETDGRTGTRVTMKIPKDE